MSESGPKWIREVSGEEAEESILKDLDLNDNGGDPDSFYSSERPPTLAERERRDIDYRINQTERVN